jgi:hypothetical protein
MLKLKICLIVTVLVIAVLGAFADRTKVLCESQQQYYKFGNSYMPVGQFGVDYFCTLTAGNCTYYQVSPGNYAPCRTGGFTWVH